MTDKMDTEPQAMRRPVALTFTVVVFVCVGVCATISLIALSVSIWAASVKMGSEVCPVEWREQIEGELMSFRQQASTLSSCECINTDSNNIDSKTTTDSNNIDTSETTTDSNNIDSKTTTDSNNIDTSETTTDSATDVSTISETNALGAVSITINGDTETKYILFPEWASQHIQVNTTSVTLQGGGRVYLGDTPVSEDNAFSTESFYQMPLLGKRLTFDIDLSRVGCNCNGALYFVQMPAHNSAHQPQPGDHGDYYCDANQVGGTFCPEMDVLEANKHAMSSTAHTCDYVAPSYYSNCDRPGCGTNILDVDINSFGPETGKQINTNRPFTLSTSFIQGSDGLLTTVTNTLTQGSQTFTFNACNPDYLQWMGHSLPGIVMTMSLWGTGDGGLSWLDGSSGCQGGCNLAQSSVTFSNFRLEDL